MRQRRWNDLPQKVRIPDFPEVCPTCGSNDPRVRLDVVNIVRGPFGEMDCMDPWHLLNKEGEK